jgi:hypothetical protein
MHTPSAGDMYACCQMTGMELKRAFVDAMKKREAGQLLQTRAMREKAAAAAGSSSSGSGSGAKPAGPAVATVRVRFPEGVCLQVSELWCGPSAV